MLTKTSVSFYSKCVTYYKSIYKMCMARVPVSATIMLLGVLPALAGRYESSVTKSIASSDTVESQDLSRDLEEIVVKADAVVRKGNLTKAYPSKRDKSLAPDLIGILSNMALPDIIVNPMGGSITTTGGEKVEVFVDYMNVSSEDIKGIRPQDVERIDIIRNPEDPRFLGNRVVANYIMKKYVCGGYTRFNTVQTLPDYYGDLNVFSRMTFKRMTFDLTGGASCYDSDARIGEEGNYRYHFSDIDISKANKIENSEQTSTNPRIRFRAVYSHGGTSVSNDLGFSYFSNSKHTQGFTDYSAIYGKAAYDSKSREKIRYVSWNGNYFFTLPHNYSLMATGNARWQKGKLPSEYVMEGNSPIIYDNRENMVSVNGSAYVNRMLGRFNVLIGSDINWMRDRFDYLSEDSQSIINSYLTVKPTINIALPLGKFILYPCAYALWRRQTINDFIDARWSGGASLPISIDISSRQSFNLVPEFNMTAPSFGNLNPVILRKTEIDAVRGNERLGYSKNMSVQAMYAYSFRTWLSANINAVFSHETSPVIPVYTPGTDSDMRHLMIRGFENNGTMTRGELSLSLTGHYFNNSLMVYVWGNVCKVIRTGKYGRQRHAARLNANASYNIGNFRISVFYNTPYREYSPIADVKYPAVYGLKGAWGWKDLFVELGVWNPFNNKGILNTSTIYGSDFSGSQTLLGSTSLRQFSCTITYSFSYGKKTDRSDELKELEKGTGNFLK